ncbi:MAG: inositol monophosphatase [Candidatus Omnitrophica bacterium]|nr:inositol monophosphatase [Candidatus Omnitrophota bacterium]
MYDIGKIKKIAIASAEAAGEYALSRMGKLKELAHKSGIHDLVTDVDRSSEKIIIEAVRKEFPEHSVLAEESGREEKDSAVMWIIDPLDGTTNFAHEFPVFCVSIGVAVEGEVTVGVVYDPSRKEFFVSEKGRGATLNGISISVSRRKSVSESLLSTGFAYDPKKKQANLDNFKSVLGKAQAVRRPGSAAIDLCYVACGRFDGFWEMYLSPWDTAAGQLMVLEAGGAVTDFAGNVYDVTGDEILATNGYIHEEMRGLFARA